MVEYQDTPADAALSTVFHALGDATRRRMLQSLAQGDLTVGQLAEPFEMSLAAASKHVKTLEAAGLIRREIQGRQHLCRLEAAPLAEADAWLRRYERFWSVRLDRLEALLRDEARPTSPRRSSPARPAPAGASTPGRKTPSRRSR